ncbi:unnamed protein product [Auanema sp. JU1783]|nr:unnamed protein product [Auanema sp. JU1783]
MQGFPSTSSDTADEGDLMQVSCAMTNVGQERKIPNGEKVRSIMRLRRIVDEMNELFEENFVLTIVNPDTSKHVSFYGSRPIVKALYNSNFCDKLKTCLPSVDKTPFYMPLVNTNQEANEYMQSESQLYSKILRILDIYNYPAREHFSYKSKGRRGCSPRPKPEYWPKDVKYGSLLCGNIAGLTEPDSTRVFDNRKAMISLVLEGVRNHYHTFLKRLDGDSQSPDDSVMVEDVMKYKELHDADSESKPNLVNVEDIDDKPSTSAAKLGTSGERISDASKPHFKKTRLISRVIGINENRQRRLVFPVGTRQPPRTKWPQLSMESSSRNFQIVRPRPMITTKDRVFTLDPNTRCQWSQYDIKPMLEPSLPMEEDVVPSTSYSMLPNNEMMGECTVIIDGQEYAVVDADEAIEPTEVYEEISLPDQSNIRPKH